MMMSVELPDMRDETATLIQEEVAVKESRKNAERSGLSRLLTAAEKKIERKPVHKDEKLHKLRYRCTHLLKVEKRCADLQNELKMKKEHVDVLTKGQACMQQQVNDSERRHTEDLTLLVGALEESKVDLGEQARLIEILVRDLQKMKSTLEYCKDELLRRDNRVSDLEEDLKKAKHNSHERVKVGIAPKIHRAQAAGMLTSKRKCKKPDYLQPLLTDTKLNPEGNGVGHHKKLDRKLSASCAVKGPADSWRKERDELQANVTKLTQEGELWKFEKAMLVSALHAAKKEFNHQHEKLIQEKLRRTTSSKCCTCETPHCHRVVEKQHHFCGLCRTKTERKALERKEDRNERNDDSNREIIMSHREQLRKQMQSHYDLEEKLRCTKTQLCQSNKKLKVAEEDRTAIAEQLAQEQKNSHMIKLDMEYQMLLLHDSLLESSARLEHVTSQIRDSCQQKESVQKNLERRMVSLQQASVDVVLENSAKTLEFKSMKLLQRLMATRLRWGQTVATNCQLLIEN